MKTDKTYSKYIHIETFIYYEEISLFTIIK